MAVTLPSELAQLLADAGCQWPDADEDRLRDLANGWRRIGQQLAGLRDEASAAAKRVSTEHQGRTVDAFAARWSKIEAHIAFGAAAADQAASVVDTLAQATLTTKTAVAGILTAGHHQQQQIKDQAAAALIGPLIAALLRMLGTALRPLLSKLVSLIRSAASAVLNFLKRAFEIIIDFFETVFGPEPPPLPPPPPPKPVYRRDEPLPHARELIANGTEWTEPAGGRGGRKLPKQGEPNQVLYLRNPPGTGPITGYSVYDERGFIIKRVDIMGTHAGMTGHVHEYKLNTNPKTGETRPGESGVREATPQETDYQ
ncbi:polymorphic toxin type 24 domain-containing protein [Saccharopolyspora sp. WRP15-2]|uniref:Polymorphic toxin type 24 domain-containing protein n=1 Tax=Saccharopolyspora oryzae TaxID=2997343 RepID=A0ABT4V4N7_9PSEU|nr:polymorphic toxin type 24 domain-containing protein [Saccharopolyspora oryzae]MDA3628924.1 polymorphic toxin type 24 domain-containing protein [Saccharopolyspora oryzae]